MFGCTQLLLTLASLFGGVDYSHAFVPSLFGAKSTGVSRPRFSPFNTIITIVPRHQRALRMAVGSKGEGGSKKKRKRRRKQPPGAVSPDPIKTSLEQIEGVDSEEDEDEDEDRYDIEEDVLQIVDVANFEFKPVAEIALGIEDDVEDPTDEEKPGSTSLPLPDIRDARRKKALEEELARIELEKEDTRVRIKRSDKEAFRQLLERQPFADADDSYFEKEEYGTVSALLGEGAKPFLGIPTGPLQVGHFIGALGVMLMAFVEYPGFPLTNLPTPLRQSLQGGLLSVFAINTMLAVFATFKAAERGQPALLWAAKTFSVGGLAFDQLTQLPTLEQVEKKKTQKGKRALKNKK